MIKDIQIDTEALVVDAYPLMHEQHQPPEMLDIAWGFYGAMVKQHPELMGEYQRRMHEMIKAVQDIQSSSRGNDIWWTDEERAEDQAIQREAALRGSSIKYVLQEK